MNISYMNLYNLHEVPQIVYLWGDRTNLIGQYGVRNSVLFLYNKGNLICFIYVCVCQIIYLLFPYLHNIIFYCVKFN